MGMTTISLQKATRERLQRYGHAGMTYDDILRRMMDRLDRDTFVADMRRMAAEADEAGDWVDLDDLDDDFMPKAA